MSTPSDTDVVATIAKFSLLPVKYEDINTLAKLSADSFATDKHTQVKMLGKKRFDMEEITRVSLENNLGRERFVHRKIVDNDTGEIAGYAGWVFCGINLDEVPKSHLEEPATQQSREEKIPDHEVTDGEEDGDKNMTDGDENKDDGEDSIARLMAMENDDMNHWQEVLMPPGTKCMILIGLVVGPQFQWQGVGGRLVSWGCEIADSFGVFIWVHSSEAAWKMYQQHGFKVVGELDINLDDWAPKPPVDGKDAAWGRYVCRYMKRLPVELDPEDLIASHP